jgi:hypothetical protein
MERLAISVSKRLAHAYTYIPRTTPTYDFEEIEVLSTY